MAEKRKTDWEAIADRYRKGEAGAELMAVELILCPSLAGAMKWPEVVSVNRQVRIGRSIADILVRHADQSITLVEVKQRGLGLRDYCTGVGQLAYQAIMAASDFQTFHVRRVLAMPGQFPVDVAIACISAGVEMLPMPEVEQWIGFIEEEAEKLAA